MLVLDTRGVLRTVAGVSALVVLGAGCASGPGGATAPDELVADAAAPATVAAPPAGTAQSDDPDAPATYTPVVRPGKAARAAKKGAAGRLAPSAPVRYPDGVTVTVERVAPSVEQGEGVGSFPGRPATEFRLRLTNGSAQPLDLSQVVVTTTYGNTPKVATPVYTSAAADFTGTVAPGATAAATYVFAIPPRQASKVSTWVDFGSGHAAAAFTGAVQ